MTTPIVESGSPAYRDPSLTTDERASDLLGRMTRHEKAAQLGSVWVFQLADGSELSTERAPDLLKDGIGHVTRVSGASSLTTQEAARLANAIQRHLIEETRLGIPAILHEEVCSGVMAREATCFPQAIGVASTWDPDLAGQLAEAVRHEMRAMGAHQGLSPVLDVCRDPRWGRTEETFGEDPYLVGRMGVAFVRGLEGPDLRNGVVATAKHFVGYGASEGGMNWAPPHIGARELREVYLHPFEACVRTTSLHSVMNAYNELDGIPCAASGELLTEILREQWGFEGTVVSDYFAARQLVDYHQLTDDPEHAAKLALEAGLDIELPSTDCYGAPLVAALESGTIDEATVDLAVSRILRTKFELGLFDDPYVDAGAAVDRTSNAALAGRIARASLVLLKNDGVLPLSDPAGEVAVIGPGADDARMLFGDYSYLAHVESLLEVLHSGRNVFAMPLPPDAEIDEIASSAETVAAALRKRLGDRVRVVRGCGVDDGSREGFAEAVAAAASASVAVMVMGDKAGLTDDCTSGESRDRALLTLPGVQEELVEAVLETGTPVVLVLVTGRPCGSERLHARCAAVLQAWFPGQEGAEAIAATLTGEETPGGKLPMTFPRGVGQVPIYYAHKVSGGRSHWKGDYVDLASSPLYPFGHGLSYTTFALSDPDVAESALDWSGSASVTVTVTNTGDRQGDEVVQLYVRDPEATVTRPVKELKSFARVALQPGAAATITFEVPLAQLGFYDRELAYVVEPGVLELSVGTSATELVSAGTITVRPDAAGLPPEKAFDGVVTVRPIQRRARAR